MTLPGDLLAHPVNEHIEIYIYIRSRKYSTTWDLPTCQAFQLLLVTRRWWSSLLEASEWWAILGGFLLLTIESNYLFELKSCSGVTIQPKLCKHHWNSPIIGMLPYAPPAKMPVTSESLARHSREKKNSCWLSGTGVAPPARHSCGNWGIDSCNWSVKVVYLDKGSPGLAVAGPIWYSARLEKTNKNTKPPRSTISFKVKHLKHWQRSQPSPLIQCLPGLWCWGASWSMAFLFTCSNFPSP